jgi:hypothetical protein
MANHKQQGPPRQGVQDVTPLLIADLEARAAAGLATYGRPLQTHNGRNAAQDALEEALDLAQYLKQVVLEQEAAAVRWVKVVSPIVCWECGHLVIATNDDPVEVVLDDREGSLAFFCCGGCANLEEAVQDAAAAPMCNLPQGGGCPHGAPGPYWCKYCRGEANAEEREHQPAAAVEEVPRPKNHWPLCSRCGRCYHPEHKSGCAAGMCPGRGEGDPVRFSAAMSDRPGHGA